MPLRILSVFVAISLIVLYFVFPAQSQAPDDALGEGELAFELDAYAAGDTAVFHIRNSALDTAVSCTATWVDVAPDVLYPAYWNMMDGEPQPQAYRGFEKGCAFDTPTTTPVHFPPDLGDSPWSALVNGVETSIEDFYEGEFTLSVDITSTSTVEIPFYFDAANTYATTTRRAKVTSGADLMGEWVGISEVASTTDRSSHLNSGVFRGSVALSVDETAATAGDSVVRVGSDGDSLMLGYYDGVSTSTISTSTASVEKATPVPAMSTLTLFVAAGLFTLLIAWRMRRSSSRRAAMSSPSSSPGG